MTTAKTPPARRRKRPTMPGSPDLFDAPLQAAIAEVEVPRAIAVAGRLAGDDQRTRAAIGRLLRRCGRTRADVAHGMTQLGVPTSEDQLDAWAAASKAHRAPLHGLRALLLAAGAHTPAAESFLDELMADTGHRVASEQELGLARIGQWYALARYARRQAEHLAEQLPQFGLRGGQ